MKTVRSNSVCICERFKTSQTLWWCVEVRCLKHLFWVKSWIWSRKLLCPTRRWWWWWRRCWRFLSTLDHAEFGDSRFQVALALTFISFISFISFLSFISFISFISTFWRFATLDQNQSCVFSCYELICKELMRELAKIKKEREEEEEAKKAWPFWRNFEFSKNLFFIAWFSIGFCSCIIFPSVLVQ